jgi:hypothetical protein
LGGAHGSSRAHPREQAREDRERVDCALREHSGAPSQVVRYAMHDVTPFRRVECEDARGSSASSGACTRGSRACTQQDAHRAQGEGAARRDPSVHRSCAIKKSDVFLRKRERTQEQRSIPVRGTSKHARSKTCTGSRDGMQPGARVGLGTCGTGCLSASVPNPESSCLSSSAPRAGRSVGSRVCTGPMWFNTPIFSRIRSPLDTFIDMTTTRGPWPSVA